MIVASHIPPAALSHQLPLVFPTATPWGITCAAQLLKVKGTALIHQSLHLNVRPCHHVFAIHPAFMQVAKAQLESNRS